MDIDIGIESDHEAYIWIDAPGMVRAELGDR